LKTTNTADFFGQVLTEVESHFVTFEASVIDAVLRISPDHPVRRVIAINRSTAIELFPNESGMEIARIIKRIAECVKLSDFSPEREATRRFQPPSIFPSV